MQRLPLLHWRRPAPEAAVDVEAGLPAEGVADGSNSGSDFSDSSTASEVHTFSEHCHHHLTVSFLAGKISVSICRRGAAAGRIPLST